MSSAERLAEDLASAVAAGSGSTLIEAPRGTGKTHLLSLIYDRLVLKQGDQSKYWPRRDDSWVGFPPEFMPGPDASPDWMWFSVACVKASGAPIPTLIGLAEQMEAHALHLATGAAPLKQGAFDLLLNQARKLAGGVVSDLVPGSQTAQVLAGMVYASARAVLDGWKERQATGVVALVQERPDLIEQLVQSLTLLSAWTPIVLAVDDIEDADPSLPQLLTSTDFQSARISVLATSNVPLNEIGINTCEGYKKRNLPTMSDEDAVRVIQRASIGTKPGVAIQIADHVDRHWADLIELMPIIQDEQPTNETVRLLPRRRSTAAEFNWSRMSDETRRAISCIAWLEGEGGGQVSPRLLDAAGMGSRVSDALGSGWLQRLPDGYRVADPLHREIATKYVSAEHQATWVKRLLTALSRTYLEAAEEMTSVERSIHLACGIRYMDDNPGPVLDRAIAKKLDHAANSGMFLVQEALSLQDANQGVRLFNEVFRICENLEITQTELLNLKCVEIQALANSGRGPQASELARRILQVAPEDALTLRQTLISAIAALDAEGEGDPRLAAEKLENELVKLNEQKDSDSNLQSELQLRLGIAHQRARNNEFEYAAEVYVNVARDMMSSPELRSIAEISGSGPEVQLRNAARVLDRGGNSRKAVAVIAEAVELAESDDPSGELATRLRRELIRKAALLLNQFPQDEEYKKAFLDCLEPLGCPTEPAELIAFYGATPEISAFTMGYIHSVALLAVDMLAEATDVLFRLEKFVNDPDMTQANMLVNLLIIRSLVTAKLRGPRQGFATLGRDIQGLEQLTNTPGVQLDPISLLFNRAADFGCEPELIAAIELSSSIYESEEPGLAHVLMMRAAQGALFYKQYSMAMNLCEKANALTTSEERDAQVVKLFSMVAAKNLGAGVDEHELLGLADELGLPPDIYS